MVSAFFSEKVHFRETNHAEMKVTKQRGRLQVPEFHGAPTSVLRTQAGFPRERGGGLPNANLSRRKWFLVPLRPRPSQGGMGWTSQSGQVGKDGRGVGRMAWGLLPRKSLETLDRLAGLERMGEGFSSVHPQSQEVARSCLPWRDRLLLTTGTL